MAIRLASILSVIILVGSILFVAGCESNGTNNAEHIDVHNFRFAEHPDGEREFSGTVVNSGDNDMSVVQIEVNLLDETGANIGTQSIEVQDIPAEDERDFNHPLNESGPVDQAQVGRILAP